MKILLINTVCGVGSTGRICTDIADLLLAQGHECRIAYGRGNVPEKYRPIARQIGSTLQIKAHAGLARLTDSAGFHSRRATKELIEWIDHWKPDLIHLHNLHGYYVNVECLFQYVKAKDIPVVWTFHDCWPYTGHCVYSDYIGCDRWQTGCYSCPKKHEYPVSMLLDRSKQNYQRKKAAFTGVKRLAIVTVSDWLKAEVKQSFMKDYKVVRIYNGIDQSVFRPSHSDIKKELGIDGKRMLLGVSDRWSERKGLSFFYRYAEEKKPDEALVMVGFNKDELPKVPQGIIALPRTDLVQQLVNLYSAADIVLNPSVEETFGLVTAEALSCGTPVIVQNATACPELVDESCGRIIEKNNYEQFKEAIINLENNLPDAQACLTRATLFDKQTNYMKYIHLYQYILEGKLCEIH